MAHRVLYSVWWNPSLDDELSGALVEYVSHHQVQLVLGGILCFTLMPAFVLDSAEGVWPRPL